MRTTRTFHTIIAAALGTACLVAGPAHAGGPVAPAPPTAARPIAPLGGGITPSYGNITPFWGNITPFYGNITPFWGNITPFYGNITPFYGNITPFWGNITPFIDSATTRDGAIKPLWGNITPFWGDVGTAWISGVNPSWGALGAAASTTDYGAVATQLQGLLDKSQLTFGAAIQSQTGRSFTDAFASPLLARYGIDLANPQTLAGFTEATRQQFFLDWYDSLMNYAGVDHPDWWMNAVNWNPSLTQTLGSGKRAIIGLLDFSITGSAGIQDNVVKYDGVSTFSNGHGTAVAGEIVAPADGSGVMGLAPMAQVIAYNPFDATGTASWADVTKGIANLTKNGANVINLSLGLPGSTFSSGWDAVMQDKTVKDPAKGTVFVFAAGNGGTVQTSNVKYNHDNPSFIIVGSVDPTGTISSFSNTPGNACLYDDKDGPCKADAVTLKSRFIVAPGELILVDDGAGGVKRVSGTSFAAPLVSGTIALLQDRWPWLANYPKETTSIVLSSARDLGAPGVDPVYGVGELDVTAAVSPLDFSKLQWLTLQNGQIKGTDIKTMAASKSTWEAAGAFVYGYEKIGGTFRDFAIPLSSRLVGQSVLAADGTQQALMGYLSDRATTWIGAQPTRLANGIAAGFNSFAGSEARVPNGSGLNLTMSVAPRTRLIGYRQSSFAYQSSVRLATPENGFGLRMGYGDGAVAIGDRAGLGLISDYDVRAGGANPLLGLASGGAYANADVAVTPRLRVTMGMTQRSLVLDRRAMGLVQLAQIADLAANKAQAMHVSAAYRLSGRVTLNAAYTHLNETSALLGTQSLDASDLKDGTASEGGTLGAELTLARTLRLSGSGTLARSHGGGSAQAIAIGRGGFVSTAYEVTLDKAHVLGLRDKARISISQPLHVERGAIDLTQIEVIDRQTGALGQVTRSFDITSRQRPYVAELLYARSTNRGGGEVSLFGRARLHSDEASTREADLMAGLRYRLGF